MLLLLVGTESRFLLESLVASLKITLIRGLVDMEVYVLFQVLVLSEPSTAKIANIPFKIHMDNNQMAS